MVGAEEVKTVDKDRFRRRYVPNFIFRRGKSLPVAELVLDLVSKLDVPSQILVSDEDPTHRARLLGHQGILHHLLVAD